MLHRSQRPSFSCDKESVYSGADRMRSIEREADGERLTPRELGSFFTLLLVAGNETARNTMAHGLKLLTDKQYVTEQDMVIATGRCLDTPPINLSKVRVPEANVISPWPALHSSTRVTFQPSISTRGDASAARTSSTSEALIGAAWPRRCASNRFPSSRRTVRRAGRSSSSSTIRRW